MLQSGLLISVIRALSASETNEQREVEKAKLERDFRQSDQRLEKLVSQHEVDLLEVMRVSNKFFLNFFFNLNSFCNILVFFFRYLVKCLRE